MKSELIYQLGLTLVPNIGDVQAKLLLHHFGTASAIFKAPKSKLERIEGIGSVRADSIKSFADFSLAEKELEFIENNRLQAIFLTDEAYPKRLLHCNDSPTLLFYKGTADLNASRIIAVVGTRSCTEYGRQFTEKLVEELAEEQVLIVSGLAFGIDSFAHKAALKNQLSTVGVVGHGLDKIYPLVNTPLAREMVQNKGGILTEFFSGTLPDKHNFPLRNRIVAGMADATIVVETNIKGGSMITAKLADSYNRDVFAVPGRVGDRNSNGCNHLIRYNKAILLTSATELLEVMGWKQSKQKPRKQRELFIELTQEESKVIELLREAETLHIDEFSYRSSLSTAAIAGAILNLELQNVIASLPGKRYRLI